MRGLNFGVEIRWRTNQPNRRSNGQSIVFIIIIIIIVGGWLVGFVPSSRCSWHSLEGTYMYNVHTYRNTRALYLQPTPCIRQFVRSFIVRLGINSWY